MPFLFLLNVGLGVTLIISTVLVFDKRFLKLSNFRSVILLILFI